MLGNILLIALIPASIEAIKILMSVYSKKQEKMVLRDRKGRFSKIMEQKEKIYVVDYKNSWVGRPPVYKQI